MELKNIQELIKLVKKADLSELSIKEADFSITIKNKEVEHHTVAANPVQAATPVSVKAVAGQQEAKQETSASEIKPAAGAATDNIVTFRSPMVGTFYRKPGA